MFEILGILEVCSVEGGGHPVGREVLLLLLHVGLEVGPLVNPVAIVELSPQTQI